MHNKEIHPIIMLHPNSHPTHPSIQHEATSSPNTQLPTATQGTHTNTSQNPYFARTLCSFPLHIAALSDWILNIQVIKSKHANKRDQRKFSKNVSNIIWLLKVGLLKVNIFKNGLALNHHQVFKHQILKQWIQHLYCKQYSQGVVSFFYRVLQYSFRE